MKTTLNLLLIYWLSFFSTLSIANDLINELNDYFIYASKSNTQNVDINKVKDLVERGVDLNSKSHSGANAIQSAFENWAYLSYNEKKSSQMKDIILYLLSFDGINVSSPDNRGLGPVYAMFRWGNRSGKDFDILLKAILKKKPDLNVTGYSKFTLGMLFSAGRGSLEDFQILLDHGLDLSGVEQEGATTLHYAVRKKKSTPDEQLLTEFVTSHLDKNLIEEYKNKQDGFGLTPLHYAVRRENLDAVKFLINNLDVKTSIKDSSKKTPLNYASELKFVKIEKFLLEHNAKKVTFSNKLTCRHRNELMKVSYESVSNLIEKCKIKKLKRLLKILPTNYLANHTVAYATLAAMDASAAHPMVITFGEDAKFMMSFNGHKSQDGFSKLDIIQFRDDTKTFEFRQIVFPKKQTQAVQYSNKNPAKCLSCHGNNPRPLWDNWTFWPGKFRGEAESIHPKESIKYEAYLKNRNKGRYKYLPGLSPNPISISLKTQRVGKTGNIKMDILTESLMTEMITREMKNTSKLYQHRYAILSALSCETEPSKLLKSDLVKSFVHDLDHYISSTKKKTRAEFINRYDLLEEFLGSRPENTYVLGQRAIGISYSDDSMGRNFRIKQTARLRYIIEGLGHSMDHWFTPFNNGQGNSYVLSSWSTVERMAWKELLSEQSDSELIKLYKQAHQDSLIHTIEAIPSLLFKSDSDLAKKVCESLKQKSLNI